MNNKIIKYVITITLLIFFNINGNCQTPTLVISEVKVNNQLINNNIIDFGDLESVVVKFKVEFTKPENLEIGQVSYVAGKNKNSGWSQFFTPQYFTLGLNNTGFSDLREYTIFASDYSVNSVNNYLSAIVQQTTGQTLTYVSNKIYIKRNPKFILTSSVNSINCGSTTPVNFTVQNIDNVNITYSWNIGNGWLLPNGSPTPATFTSLTNTLSLTPNSFPLSSVNVTPIYNGNNLTVRSKTITLAPLSNNSEIQGSGIVCPGSTYTFNLTNNSTFTNVSWNIPQFGVASITGSTNSSVTIEIITSGTFTINALVTNSCGQTGTVSRTFNVGAPYVNPNSNTIFGVSDWYPTNYSSPVVASVYNVENVDSYVWSITGSTSVSGCTNRPKFSNGSSTTMTTYTNQVNINWGGCAGNFVLSCKPQNVCGVSYSMELKGVTIDSPTNNPCNNNPIGGKMRNPIKEDTDIVLSIHHSQLPCRMVNNIKVTEELTIEQIDAIKYNVEIYDFFGRRILSKKDLTSEIIIQDANLSKGKYIINISNDLGYIKREILLVE